MILITDWWGLQMFAETYHDEAVIKDIYEATGDRASDFYEDGTVEILTNKEGVMYLEIHR